MDYLKELCLSFRMPSSISRINVKNLSFYLIFLFQPFLALPSYSQSEMEIVSNYRKAIKKTMDDDFIHSIEVRGTFSIKKISLPTVIYYKNPNLTRVEMTIQNATFVQISNDSLSWEYNPFEDKSTFKPVEKKSDGKKKENSSFDFLNQDLLEYEKLNYRLKLLAKEKMDSLDVYVLELSKDKKDRTKFYINTKTFLLHKVEDKNGYRYFANYIVTHDYVFPKLLIDAKADEWMEGHFNEVVINNDLADTLFRIPKSDLESRKNAKNKLQELLDKADQFYQLGEYDSAYSSYTQFIRSDDKNYRVLNSRGLTAIALKNYYEAISDFNRAIEVDPAGSKAFNNRGLAKFYLGDKESAVKDYTKALEMDTSFVVAYKNRGTAYLQDGKLEEAKNDFSKAIELSPDDGQAYFKQGIALALMEKYEDALRVYALAMERGYQEADIFNYRGVSEFKLARYENAKISFHQAVQQAPDNLQYLENYGRSLYELDELQAASEQFENYLKKKNDKSEIHNLNGLCKYRDENYKGAIDDFSKAISFNKSNATYYDNRAAAKEMLEDYEGAIVDYSESIKLYPQDPNVFYKRGLIKIYTSKKIEGCLDLATANEMSHEPAREAIMKNCH